MIGNARVGRVQKSSDKQSTIPLGHMDLSPLREMLKSYIKTWTFFSIDSQSFDQFEIKI